MADLDDATWVDTRGYAEIATVTLSESGHDIWVNGTLTNNVSQATQPEHAASDITSFKAPPSISADFKVSIAGDTPSVEARLLNDVNTPDPEAQNLPADVTITKADKPAAQLAAKAIKPDSAAMGFEQIENVLCFTPKARILTSRGDRAIETLQVGDKVVTRDHGLRPIRWIGKRTVDARGALAPILIAPNVAEAGSAPLMVSPQHRILFAGYRAELLFGKSEVLVPAKYLVDGQDVIQQAQDQVTYVHLMFDRHEVIYADGIAAESFYAGDIGLTTVSEPAREELFKVFPELRSAGSHHRQTVRTCLQPHEATSLRDSVTEEENWLG